MPLCGSTNCACAITSTPATTNAIAGEYPQIVVDGSGTAASPWNLSLNSDWAAEVASGVFRPTADYTAVGSPEANVMYYDTSRQAFLFYNGTAWLPVTPAWGWYQVNAVVVPTTTLTTVTLTAVQDPYGWIDGGGATPTFPGTYEVTTNILSDTTTSQRFQVRALVDTVSENFYSYIDGVGAAGSGHGITIAVELDGTQKLETRVFHVAGGDLTLDAEMIVRYVGPT